MYFKKTFYIQHFTGPVETSCDYIPRGPRLGWSFSPQRIHARSTVVAATLFAHEHALRGKLLRQDHTPW